MDARINDDTIAKLVVLFVFEKMEMPLSENTVCDFCTSNELLTYMDCKLSFRQMIENGFLIPFNQNVTENTLYSITSEGLLCISTFFHKIPSSIREEISVKVKEQRMNYRRKQEYFSNYSKNPDGTYKVLLKINDTSQTMMELTVNVTSREIAKRVYERWSEKAPEVYQLIYDLLVE